ncbi:zinc finger HIT domain-containing protein 3 isoform X2 [Aquila chrysaetos chrysaetos]|uniref:zinc finger HIT domain-containing protein 3 isoform X2 n=1 Tax=Aquila chrysaetos chrysaetos TaxID=223781 RepID=UPI0011764F1A|nr:zinc finger HIT domain-containing protein 3 isoform X2 [Aquila chrysaetos chrysaetos]
MRAPRPCGVCGAAGAAKYRCPRCAAGYCSVLCCRAHKERCPPEPKREEERERPAAVGQLFPGGPLNGGGRQAGESEELRGLLLNPHLQQLLLTVDQAEDKSSLMKKYMQEPLFVEFADCCLRIVEPPEKENILPE